MRNWKFLWVFFSITLSISLLLSCSKKEEEKTREEKSAQIKQQKIIKIGAILPLTGYLSFLGEPGKNAIELFKNQYRLKNLEIKLYDSKGTAKDGLNAFYKANNVDKNDLFSITLTGVSLAIKPKAYENTKKGFFFISIYPDLAKDLNNGIQFCYSAKQEAEKICQYIRHKDYKKIFIVASRDSVTSKEVHALLKPCLEQSKQVRLHIEDFDIGQKDFKNIVNKVKNFKPNSIVILGYGSDIKNFLRQYNDYNLDFKIIGGIGFIEIDNNPSNYNLVKNAVFTIPNFMIAKYENDKLKEFKKQYTQQFKKLPTYDAIYTYALMESIWQAVSNNKFDSSSILSYIKGGNVKDTVIGKVVINSETNELITDVVLSKYTKHMKLIEEEN